jgi:hypothetical protein
MPHGTRQPRGLPDTRRPPAPPVPRQASRGFGKQLRVAEMNTISNSGREGVSNVFASALWTVDACFEVAATGAIGVNIHQVRRGAASGRPGRPLFSARRRMGGARGAGWGPGRLPGAPCSRMRPRPRPHDPAPRPPPPHSRPPASPLPPCSPAEHPPHTHTPPHTQGSGQNLYTSIVRWYQNDTLSPVVIRPAFYGLLLFQQAVRGGSRMLPASVVGGSTMAGGGRPRADQGPDDGIKVWPLWGDAERELRVVVINKRPSEAVTVVLRLPRRLAGAGFGPAAVSRMVAPGDAPLEARGGVSLGGITFAVGGAPQGAPTREAVPPAADDDGAPAWPVYMPPGSAALVVIPRSGTAAGARVGGGSGGGGRGRPV